MTATDPCRAVTSGNSAGRPSYAMDESRSGTEQLFSVCKSRCTKSGDGEKRYINMHKYFGFNSPAEAELGPKRPCTDPKLPT